MPQTSIRQMLAVSSPPAGPVDTCFEIHDMLEHHPLEYFQVPGAMLDQFWANPRGF